MMKKALSLALCTVMCLGLFACGKAETQAPADTTSDEVMVAATVAEVTTVVFSNKVKANGYCPALLPLGFPETLPAELSVSATTHYDAAAENNPYGTEYYRIRMVIPLLSLPTLNATMKANGWEGAATYYNQVDDTTGIAETDWLEGFWKQGDYVAVISDNSYETTSSGEIYTISIDIVPRSAAFPAQLAAYFPAFNGACLFQDRVYTVKNGEYTLTAPDALGGKSWRWEFNGNGVFIGVTEQEAFSYLQALSDAGFITASEQKENDYGDYVIFTAEKTQNNRTYYAQFLYAAYAETLMAVYTNNYDAMQ